MSKQNISIIMKQDYLLLLPIMALAFYITFIPHNGYPYLVHLDEWLHLACSNQVISQATTIGISSPFDGGEPTINQVVEFGSHVFWAVFYKISGIPWLDIYKYFPSIIFIITVLSVYVLAQRQGFGWEAAFLTCLIPTTVGILGPGFLVPVAMGLLYIPLSLLLAINVKTWWSYLALFIFICFLCSIHSVTALALAIILTPFIFLNLKGNFKHSLGIILTIAIPFLVAFLLMSDTLLSIAKSLLTSKPLYGYVDLPQIITTYGYLPISLCLLGTFLLAIRGGKRNYGLVLGLLALLLVLTTYFTFHYGIDWLYYRGLMYMMLMMSIVAGAGLSRVKKLRLPISLSVWLKVPFITKNVGNIVCLILIGFILYTAIPDRQDTPYYHMIDDKDYQVFIWIKENIDSSYDKAILDPWKGAAFTAITGRKVYSHTTVFPSSTDREAYNFLEDGCKDTTFMNNNGISIVYTRQGCDNPDLIELRDNVYLLKEAKKPE